MVFNIKRCVSSENLNENFFPTLSKAEEHVITAHNTKEIIGSIPIEDSTVPNINPIEAELKISSRKKKMFTRFGQLDTCDEKVPGLENEMGTLNSTSAEPFSEFSSVGMQITIVKSKSGNIIRKDIQTSLKEKLVSSGYLDLFDWGIETSSGLKSELEKCHTGGLIFQDLGEEVKKVMEESEKKLQNMFSKFDNEDAICVSELIPEKKRKFNIFLTEVLTLLVTKQVQFIRKKNIEHFKDTLYSSEQPSELLFEDACDNFKRDCEASFYQSIGWNTFDDEYSVFREILLDIVYRHKQLITEKLQNSERESVALNLLQMQQAQLHAIQQQQYGGGPGNWNIGIAYRPLRSNVNISLGYQQGRANIQVSMVPEEQAGLLGPNGFTAGVGPGNLGVSFNISL